MNLQLRSKVTQSVAFNESQVHMTIMDGRTVTAPLAWYPRLAQASPAERNNWRLIGRGEGIHWRDLDEDISIENLLTGRPSGESQTSFARWLEGREAKVNS